MTRLTIIIQDLEKETPAEPHIKEVEVLNLETAVILERGTINGDTGLSLRAVGIDGKNYVIQMTGNIFRSLNSAFTGADARFKQKQANKN